MEIENYESFLAEMSLPSFNVIDVHDFLNLDIPPRENILSPWLPEQGLAMIYAPRGIGKTYVALSIADAIVRGTSFLEWKASKPHGVLYLDGEMPANLMQERIKAITASQEEIIKAPFRLITPDMQGSAMPDLSRREDQAPFLPG